MKSLAKRVLVSTNKRSFATSVTVKLVSSVTHNSCIAPVRTS